MYLVWFPWSTRGTNGPDRLFLSLLQATGLQLINPVSMVYHGNMEWLEDHFGGPNNSEYMKFTLSERYFSAYRGHKLTIYLPLA